MGRFPAVGQYLVLWSYTLVFWGLAFWTAKQDSLKLTASTLETIAVSLIPLNFWAIDSLNLWSNFGGWLVVAIASVSLTAIYLIQNKQNLPLLLNFLLLCYLHWGWNYHNLALVAVYIGAIGTSFTVSFLAKNNSSENRSPIQRNRGLIIFALAVLLARAILIFSIPIQQLGLAIGMCGWLLTKEKGQEKSSIEQNLAKIGTILIFIAWLVSLGQEIPWQATIISALAIEYCLRQLQQNWLRRDLLAIFVIGLQGYLLLGQLIPQQLRLAPIAAFVSLANSSAYPTYTLYSLSLFPYLICCVGMANWLYRKKKSDLAIFGEWLTIILGITLTGISVDNPIGRSLNLSLSTATLFYVSTRRTPTRVALVYFTHILGISTIVAWLNYWLPNLSNEVWANIFIVLMVIEWGISNLKRRSDRQQIWYESCWYLGLSLAAISYILLLDNASNLLFVKEQNFWWSLSWLLTPVTLTIVASRVEEERRIYSIWLSSLSAIAVQFLTVWQPLEIRLFSLSVANGLMLVNTRYGKDLKLAAINIGFVLSFVVALLWGKISLGNWYLLGAIAIVVLSGVGKYLLQKNGTITQIYAKVADGWAYFLWVVELFSLTLNYLPGSHFYLDNYTWQYVAASILISSAIAYRYWRQPDNTSTYSFAWGMECTVTGGILLAGGSNLELATANIFLALLSLLVSRKQYLLFELFTLRSLPIIYALISIAWRWNYFTAHTGWLTLAAGIIGILAGSRYMEVDETKNTDTDAFGKIISYLSVAGITCGCYELVIYQMM